MFKPEFVDIEDLSQVPDGNIVAAMANVGGDFQQHWKFVKVSIGLVGLSGSWPVYTGYIYTWEEVGERPDFLDKFYMDLGVARPAEDTYPASGGGGS